MELHDVGRVAGALPNGTTQVLLVTAVNGRETATPVGSVKDGAWTVDAPALVTLQRGQISGGILEFDAANGAICRRPYVVAIAGVASVPAPPQPARRGSTLDDCFNAGERWKGEIETAHRGRGGSFTEIVFLDGAEPGGGVCYYNRDYGVVGDPIFVGVFTTRPDSWLRAQFEPCALQNAAPNVLQGSDKFPDVVARTLAANEYTIQKFLPRTCFNTPVDVEVVVAEPTPAVAQKYPLNQYDRYRATLHAGILLSKLHDASFALRADQADPTKQFIYDQGPTNSGPEYVAALELYAVLKYFPQLLGRLDFTRQGPYAGRDPIHDGDFLDRLGAVIGVGIKNPMSRFDIGASFEALYGVNVIWVLDYARIRGLAPNVDTAAPFTGTAATIPTAFRWEHRGTLGLSVDLRYLSVLFSGGR
ncbi:hypothetical protein [Gemmatirosa kalamazoonensis]|uniref:hypothetical protein n=1 Tax=Gemmatirosa kalamazoonensis TaxID=861299 RepID=UPI0004B0477C|nr:hypothetical protein [Gemmatirosa kalamazoonensis]